MTEDQTDHEAATVDRCSCGQVSIVPASQRGFIECSSCGMVSVPTPEWAKDLAAIVARHEEAGDRLLAAMLESLARD